MKAWPWKNLSTVSEVEVVTTLGHLLIYPNRERKFKLRELLEPKNKVSDILMLLIFTYLNLWY